MGYDLKISLECQRGCRSCYEARCRTNKTNLKPYNLSAILSTLDRITEEDKTAVKNGARQSETPCLHGGEPLLIEFHDLHALCRKVYSYWHNGNIQTNLIALTPEHIHLFQDYNISVGLSLDGDTGHMNRGRWNAPGLGYEYADEMTAKTLENMVRLRNARIPMSIICVLRKYNARPEMLSEMSRFLLRIYDEFGIVCGRTNPCIVFDDKYRNDEELTPAELGLAFQVLAGTVLTNPHIVWQPYHDVIDMMLGYLDQTCNFNECDPFHTRAEMAINRNGQITNCLKSGAALEGIQALQCNTFSIARYRILYQLSQENYGCKKCRWWYLCMGGCPGEAENNDYRNRTRFCMAYQTLFERIEQLLRSIMPNLMLSQDFYPYRPDPSWCQRSLNIIGNPSSYRSGAKSRVDTVLTENETNLSGRLYLNNNDADNKHGDRHGDKPHGDHTDQGRRRP